MKWKYKTEYLYINPDQNPERLLNEFGSQGWELVCILNLDGDWPKAIFKKEEQ